MSKNGTSCSRVSDDIICPKCKEKKVVRNGTTKNKKQQYHCKICEYRFIENYTYPVLKDGVATGEMVLCDPICSALYYAYIGCEIYLKNGLLESYAIIVKELTKSIFDKYDSETFDLLCRSN